MSLLQTIQNNLLSEGVSIATTLRRCTVLAKRLGPCEFADWISQELKGYEDTKTVPDYRKIHVHMQLSISDGFRILSNVPAPLENVAPEFRRFFTEISLAQSAREIEALVLGAVDGALKFRCAPVALDYYRHRLVKGWEVLSIDVSVPSGKIAGVLDAVKNRILDSILELEQQLGIDEESWNTKDPEKMKTIENVLNLTVNGTVNNLSAGSTHSPQTAGSQIISQGTSDLREALEKLGVTPADVSELESAIAADPPPEKNQTHFRPKVAAWVGRLCSSAMSGAGVVAVTTATKVAPALLAQHLGVELPTD